MSYRQVYYTSCEKGLGIGAGFQFNAMSDGVDSSLAEAVKRAGTYTPPRSAPTNPSADDIESFPIALFYQNLPSGVRVLGQSRYIGKDYSGRFGNFFVHGLVAEPGSEPLGVLPIELWGSSTWVTKQSSSTSLPRLEEPSKGEIISRQAVAQFVCDATRAPRISDFISAVVTAMKDSKKIVIVDDRESTALWIALASYVLPRNLATQLSFSTYSNDPKFSNALIVGTTADSKFSFSRLEIEHQYSVFDFVQQRFTRFTNHSSFCSFVAEAYRTGKSKLVDEFVEFVTRDLGGLSIEELDPAFAFHLVANNQTPSKEMSREILGWMPCHLGKLPLDGVARALRECGHWSDEVGDVGSLLSTLLQRARCEVKDGSLIATTERTLLVWMVSASAHLHHDRMTALCLEAGLKPSSIPPIAAEIRPAWLDVLAAASAKAMSVLPTLQLGLNLGYIHHRFGDLSRLGESVIGPALLNPEVLDFAINLVQHPGNGSLASGIALALQQQCRSHGRSALIGVSRFALVQSMVTAIRDLAKRTEDFDLLCHLAAVESSANPTARSSLFREYSLLVILSGASQQNVVQQLFDAIWPSRLPTIAECLSLVGTVRDVLIANGLVPSVVEALELGADGRLADQGVQELAAALSEIDPAIVGAKLPVIRAFSILRAFRSRDNSDIGGLVAQAVQCAEVVSTALSQQLLDSAADAVFTKFSEQEQLAILRDPTLSPNHRLLRSFGQVVVRALTAAGPARPRLAARLFRGWVLEERDFYREPTATLISDLLFNVIRSWTKADLKAVQSHLACDAHSADLWTQWTKRVLERDGLVGKVMKFFGRN